MDVWTAISHLRAGRTRELDQYFNGLQESYERDEIDDSTLANKFVLVDVSRVDLLPAAETWANAFPQSYAAHQVLLTLHVRVAWEARSERGSASLSERQIETMEAHFASAHKHVDIAVKLAKRPILAYREWSRMEMAAGVRDDAPNYRAQIEALFPKSLVLCTHEFGRLHPKWGGTEGALDAFMARVRKWGFTDGQRQFLEAQYLEERADMSSCEGEMGDAFAHATAALGKERTFQALVTMAALHRGRKELPIAIRYYEEALADHPSGREYYFLGYAHEENDDVPNAVDAFEKALALGYGEAASSLVWCFKDAAPDPALRARLDAWFDQGVSQYSSNAMNARGNFIFNGYCGYPKDQKQVAHWWHMAGEWGNAQALENLTKCYWDGKHGFPKDYKKAFATASAAADICSDEIADSMGRMHYQGHGTPVDYEAAIPYLIAAAHQDNAQSIACLIRALWFGQGTDMDHDDAKDWLNHLRELDREEYDEVKSAISGPIAWMKVLIAKFKARKPKADA